MPPSQSKVEVLRMSADDDDDARCKCGDVKRRWVYQALAREQFNRNISSSKIALSASTEKADAAAEEARNLVCKAVVKNQIK